MIEAVLDNLRTYWMAHGLLLLYTLMLVQHALEGNRETEGIADYYIGGRSLGGVAMGLSFFATYSSTNSFVGFSGQSYSWGLPWLLLVPAIVGFVFVSWKWVAPRLRHFTEALDSLTIPDFIGFRFDSTPARALAAVIIIFASFFYMTAVFKGIGNLLQVFLEIPYRMAIVLVFFAVMAYTAVGGFMSVVKTDAVQGVVMAVAAVLLFWGTADAAGGVDALAAVREMPEAEHLFTWEGGVSFAVLLGVIFAGTIKFVVDPRQLSRFYALENREAARTGIWVSTGVFAGAYLLLVPVGLYARRLYPTGIEDTDLVVPTLVGAEGVFSGGVSAFLMVAMVAAAMSSLDSVLLVMASTCERDLMSVWREPESEDAALRSTRWYVALFALVTAVIALNPPGGVVSLTAFSGSLYGACFLPAVVLGLYWRQGNGAAVVASFVAGLAVLLGWRFLPFADVLHEVFPALFLALSAYVGVAWATRPAGHERMEEIFDEVEAWGTGAEELVAEPAGS